MKYFCIIPLIFALAMLPLHICGQSRSLPLLEINPDARMTGMGGNQYGEAHSMLIYSNPTSSLYDEEKWNVSASTLIFPKQEDLNDRNMFYAVSLSRRFGNHAIHAGMRYLGGLSVPMDEGNALKPADWTVDLAYSLRLFDHFSFNAGVSLIHSKVVEEATTAAFNIGAYYRNSFNMGINADYVVGINAFNMGPNLDYGQNYKEAKLPAGFGAGGELGMNLDDKNQLNVSLAGQYYCMPNEAKLFTENIGVEYGFNRMFFVRGGYKYAEHDYSSFAFGAGVNYRCLTFDVAHQRGLGSNEINQTLLSLSFKF